MVEASLTVSKDVTEPLPFWKGQKTVDIRLELSDGTVDVIQMSVNFARVFAKELLRRCDSKY